MVNSTLCKTLVSKFKTKTSKNLSLHDAKLPSQKWAFKTHHKHLQRSWDLAKIFQDPHLFGTPFYTPWFRFPMFHWDTKQWTILVNTWNPCSPNTKLVVVTLTGPNEIRGFEWVVRQMVPWSCELDLKDIPANPSVGWDPILRQQQQL